MCSSSSSRSRTFLASCFGFSHCDWLRWLQAVRVAGVHPITVSQSPGVPHPPPPPPPLLPPSKPPSISMCQVGRHPCTADTNTNHPTSNQLTSKYSPTLHRVCCLRGHIRLETNHKSSNPSWCCDLMLLLTDTRPQIHSCVNSCVYVHYTQLQSSWWFSLYCSFLRAEMHGNKSAILSSYLIIFYSAQLNSPYCFIVLLFYLDPRYLQQNCSYSSWGLTYMYNRKLKANWKSWVLFCPLCNVPCLASFHRRWHTIIQIRKKEGKYNI